MRVDPRAVAAAYDTGRVAALRSPPATAALLRAGHGQGYFEVLGSDFTLVPAPPYRDEDRATDWAVGYAHALEDIAAATLQQ